MISKGGVRWDEWVRFGIVGVGGGIVGVRCGTVGVSVG